MEEWIKKLGEGWASLDPASVMELFDRENIKYYEEATDEPVTDWEGVKELWDVVPSNQKDVEFSSKIICQKDDYAIVNWQVTRYSINKKAKQLKDGIFEIRLNKSGKCIYFKQWVSTKEI
jgi:hypothetical protein